MAKQTPKFPEIEALSEKERRNLWAYAMSMRSEERRGAIDWVVQDALAYHAENQRNDGFHKARMSMRFRDLMQTIKDACETMNRGDVTDEELASAKRIREMARDAET